MAKDSSAVRYSFDWGLVRSFLAVMEQGSLLAAARSLRTSQPTLGRHVAELESQLGKTLFDRTGRGLLPTPAAWELVEAARAMEAGALHIERQLAGAQTRISGTVRLSASTPVACALLPRLLLAMRQSLPDVQVELVASNTVSNLLRREADIALRMVAPEQATLVARRVGQVKVGAFASRDYLRRHGTPNHAEDLLTHDLIGLDQDDTYIRGFARMGQVVTRERFAFRSDDLMVQWEAVRAGLGIGFVAQHVARGDREVQQVLPALKLPNLPMWLVVHRDIRSNKRIRAVFDFLAQQVPKALP